MAFHIYKLVQPLIFTKQYKFRYDLAYQVFAIFFFTKHSHVKTSFSLLL